MIHKWEKIQLDDNDGCILGTARMQLPGGWLIMVESSVPDMDGNYHYALSTVFISDEKHEWKVDVKD